MARVKDGDSFIEKARQVHGDEYDYSRVNYVNTHEPVEIICPKHGIFKQSPNSHLNGRGCRVCAKNEPINAETFFSRVKKIYGDKYDFSNVVYNGLDTPVTLICPKHGEFEKTPRNLLRGHACPLCGREGISNARRETKEKFIKKARAVHGDVYDYSNVELEDSLTPVAIVCPKHGVFYQSPASHLMGHGCPECAKTFGISEARVFDAVKAQFPDTIAQYKPSWLQSRTSYQSIDVFIPQYNIGIEYQGAQHFVPIAKFGGETQHTVLSERDIRKYNKCKEHGIKLFYISFERSIPKEYHDVIYTTIPELLSAINDYITTMNTMQVTEADIRTMVKEAVKTLLNNYL